MTNRLRRILLVTSVLWLSWLLMMLMHEAGHVIGAIATGGRVQRVVWHPLVMSRTDVDPNPHPAIETWAGPAVGCALPLMAAIIATAVRWRGAYLVWTVAGFSLFTNGVYVGTGVIHPVGDAAVLVKLGTPLWLMAVIGKLSNRWWFLRVASRQRPIRIRADVETDRPTTCKCLRHARVGFNCRGFHIWEPRRVTPEHCMPFRKTTACNSMPHTMNFESFLNRHGSFGGWTDSWEGVPLDFRVHLADELPERDWVGSVRALVLRGDQVLLVYSTPPILSVGGRCEAGESIEQTLHREVGEETGWRVRPIAVIGFIHTKHLDDQRPAWGRPAPDWIDPLFAVEATEYDASLLGEKETRCEFVPIADVERHGIETINRTFLREAIRVRK